MVVKYQFEHMLVRLKEGESHRVMEVCNETKIAAIRYRLRSDRFNSHQWHVKPFPKGIVITKGEPIRKKKVSKFDFEQKLFNLPLNGELILRADKNESRLDSLPSIKRRLKTKQFENYKWQVNYCDNGIKIIKRPLDNKTIMQKYHGTIPELEPKYLGTLRNGEVTVFEQLAALCRYWKIDMIDFLYTKNCGCDHIFENKALLAALKYRCYHDPSTHSIDVTALLKRVTAHDKKLLISKFAKRGRVYD